MSFSRKIKSSEMQALINDANANANTSIDTNTNINRGVMFPWSKLQKKSKKRVVFNLRLNSYYHEAVKYFSKNSQDEETSMQAFVRRIIEKEIDSMIQKEGCKHSQNPKD